MKSRDLVYIAVGTVGLVVSGWLAFPVGAIPITLQTLVLGTSVGLLGWKRGFFAVLAYLLLGFVGIPVFSGFTGGAAALLSPTGGYLLGFLFFPLVMGVFFPWAERAQGAAKILPYALGMLLGVFCCYAFGTLWFTFVVGGTQASGFLGALSLCVLPYLPFDIVKIAMATTVVLKFEKLLKI